MTTTNHQPLQTRPTGRRLSLFYQGRHRRPPGWSSIGTRHLTSAIRSSGG